MYGVLCLMLMTFAPLINSHAAVLQPSASSEFKSIEIKSKEFIYVKNQSWLEIVLYHQCPGILPSAF